MTSAATETGICADIGGSFIKFAEVDQSGEPMESTLRPTPATSWEAFCETLQDLCAQAPAHVPLGLSIAGVVDPDSGLAFSANLPCLNGRPVAQMLSHRLGRPVRIANDADCMVLAEALRGAGQGHHVVFGIVLGSGVGGGLVIDGRIVRGAGGIAGEWGHGPLIGPMTIGAAMVAQQRCGCGQIGCLDTLGGALGLARLHGLVHGETRDSRNICRGWHEGEASATVTIEAWLTMVAGPLAVMVNASGAGIVPVAGGLGNDSALVAALDAAVRQRILRRGDKAVVVPSRFGDRAGLVGAALLLAQGR